MKTHFCPLLLAAVLSSPLVPSGAGAEMASAAWETGVWGIESGFLWQVGKDTSIDYRIVPTQVSWRSSEVFGVGLASGGRVVVRNRFGLLANWVERGPESYYLALNASPSVEWWNVAGNFAFFGGAGGGAGWTDSRGVEGGQGQDFAFHWFARAGMESLLSEATSLTAGVFFLHMSNLGLTDPNPGIDALGFTVGFSRKF